MLIGFLGAPMSGKTTAALGLSYGLKLDNVACEYMPEPARVVIDHLGYNNQSLIADLERKNIQRAKQHSDRVFITDGGIYMGQFYGGPAFDTEDYDLVVLCTHVYEASHDSARMQNHAQALIIQDKMIKYAQSVPNSMTYCGDIDCLKRHVLNAKPI